MSNFHGVTVEMLRRQYGRCAESLAALAATAGRRGGVHRGRTEAQWRALAEEYRAVAAGGAFPERLRRVVGGAP